MDSQKNTQTLLNTPLHGVQLQNPNLAISQTQSHTQFQLDISIHQTQAPKPNSQAIWTLKDQGERYTTLMELYKTDKGIVLNIECEGRGTFTFTPNHIDVNWQQQGTQFEHYFQSVGIACWLELQHIPCIHANTVTLGDEAYLIIAPSRTGKSTLTTALLNHGFKLMTDDMVAIYPQDSKQYIVYPSWPKIRLWPDSVDALLGPDLESENSTKSEKRLTQQSNLARSTEVAPNKPSPALKNKLATSERAPVHQKFAKSEIKIDTQDIWEQSPKKLKAIYFLERQEQPNQLVKINKLTASTSLMMLLQNSILANAYTGLGLETERLKKLAEMVNILPVYKMEYQTGLKNLAQINTELKKHIQELS
ncbi:hypothetical protein L0668_17385 [Paraglaciecola aquimarina]|uniref:Serine kinase n=1 Tax=Paraglaciecola algarum TaxID=3050085 RepID=A0ABS9DAM8_9ALTE|nr:hypothetical protein [Paraglaciecola sp. G1-23]MCF2949896.1 hypothetical protein [Paraglaciecola sp. G1-23]